MFIDQGKPEAMYEFARLGTAGIVETVFKALGRETLATDSAGRA